MHQCWLPNLFVQLWVLKARRAKIESPATHNPELYFYKWNNQCWLSNLSSALRFWRHREQRMNEWLQTIPVFFCSLYYVVCLLGKAESGCYHYYMLYCLPGPVPPANARQVLWEARTVARRVPHRQCLREPGQKSLQSKQHLILVS